MKTSLFIYKSSTGFTKKYIDWILEEVPGIAVQLDSDVENGVNQALLRSYDHCKKENIEPLVLKLKTLLLMY